MGLSLFLHYSIRNKCVKCVKQKSLPEAMAEEEKDHMLRGEVSIQWKENGAAIFS